MAYFLKQRCILTQISGRSRTCRFMSFITAGALFWGVASVAWSEEVSQKTEPVLGASKNSTELESFSRSYLSLEISRNDPIGPSTEHFSPGHEYLALSYMHIVNQTFLMGFGTTFRSWFREDTSQELALLSIIHTSSYIFRLYEPTYLLPGVKLSYLLPATGAKFPPEPDNDFAPEIGVGLSLTLLHHISKNAFLSFRIERWRGTTTSRFHGIELAFGLGRSL